jgi:hypothetical protein
MGLYNHSKKIASIEQRIYDASYPQKDKDTFF